MPKPPGTKIHVQEKKNASPNKKLSRSLVTLFTIYQLCFGFHFVSVNLTNGKFKKLVNFVTWFMASIMFSILSVKLIDEKFSVLITFVDLIQYVAYFFVLISSKYSLHDFLIDLKATDRRPLVKSDDEKLGMIAWCYTASMFLVKFVSFTIHGLGYVDNTNLASVSRILMYIPTFGVDFIPVANYSLFHHIYIRMRNLRKELESQEIKLDQFPSMYKMIADCVERFRKYHDAIFIVGFVTNAPKWMILIFNHLKLMKSSSSWLSIVCSYAWAFHLTVQICVPAVFAEMINAQTDAMKMMMHERSLVATDEAVSTEWTQVLRYVDTRPLLRKAWRLVPVDLRLPIAMLSMCTTYLIVIIQFTHLF